MAAKQPDRRYFSQNGEDYLLWQFFDDKPSGFYIEVGAFDGIHLSNTYSFEQQGWTGLCIEPHPTYFTTCQQNRPGSICLNVACVADEAQKTVEFYSETIGLLSGTTGGKHRQADVKCRYEGRNLPFEDFERVTTPAAALRRYLVRGRGYVLARRIAQNLYFVRNYRDADRLRRLAVDCMIERTLHPLGERYTAQPYLVPRRVQCGPELDTPDYRVKRALGPVLPRRFR